MGYELVSIETEPEQVWLVSAANEVRAGDNTWWVGLNDRGFGFGDEGDFDWIATGANMTYDNFAGGEPNDGGGIFASEDCVEMRDDGRWNDEGCGSDRFFICEVQP